MADSSDSSGTAYLFPTLRDRQEVGIMSPRHRVTAFQRVSESAGRSRNSLRLHISHFATPPCFAQAPECVLAEVYVPSLHWPVAPAGADVLVRPAPEPFLRQVVEYSL